HWPVVSQGQYRCDRGWRALPAQLLPRCLLDLGATSPHLATGRTGWWGAEEIAKSTLCALATLVTLRNPVNAAAHRCRTTRATAFPLAALAPTLCHLVS